MKIQKQAFTLVELIVVIVILAILGTIAFISFQGYSRNSRDGVRIADINSAKKSLEIFITKAGFYPIPDGATNITYSGATVWIEGTLGENVIKNIQSVSKVITDPLTVNEYTYSITSSKTEYQIGAISEGGGLTNNTIINNTYATDLSKINAVAYISGNYNEKFTKVNTGTTSWILAQPSIIVSDIGNTDLGNILSNKKVVFNNYGNYPHSYNQNSTGGFDYNKPTQLIYSGDLLGLHDENTTKIEFFTNLQNAYTGTILAQNPIYEEIMSVNPINNTGSAINVIIDYINTNKGGIRLKYVDPINNITSSGGESGGEDPVSASDYDSCTGQKIPAPFSATSTYPGCDTPDIVLCSGAGTGYTLSACNVGSTIAGTGASSYGKYFQFGRNDESWNVGQSAYSYDWKSPGGTNAGSANDWGVLESVKTTATWGNSSESDRLKMQGPCEDGYHIPTNSELLAIHTAGQWLYGGAVAMVEELKLPRAGYRNRNTSAYTNLGTYGYYRTSSPNGSEGFHMSFDSTGITPDNYFYRSNGYSVRCIKN
ncbi:MAG: prepilin-type N-terminal cleavage/methylation domain-containing protein [Candidatus Gracilibacteria bacterium]|nr:prepilin-type N-terminal cleavage/methylation domain-containing protein [Candidatus Gracilibacteria bacterium]